MALRLWTPMMDVRLIHQLDCITRISVLVNSCISRNQEPQTWFERVANLLHEVTTCISNIRTAAHRVADHPCQEDWVGRLSHIVACEIDGVLGVFAYLGGEIQQNVRISYPGGRSTNIVGSDEPITKLENLLQELRDIQRISEENMGVAVEVNNEEQGEDADIASPSSNPIETEQINGERGDEWPIPIQGWVPWVPNSNRIKGFLRDDRVLQQAYQKWIELKSMKDIRLVNTCPCNSSDKMCLHEATNVVQWWNPFHDLENSDDVRNYLEALEVIISFPGSSCRNIKNLGEEALEIASSRLKDLFCCLIDANAELHDCNYGAPPTHSSSLTPYGEREDVSGSWYTSSSANTVAQASTSELIDADIALQQPNNETEEASGRVILKHFLRMISRIVELARGFCKVNYDRNILIRPFNQAFDDVIKKKMASLGFHDMDREFQEMFVENWASTQRPVLSESRKNFVRAHMGARNATIPWKICLCNEIFFPLPGFKGAFYTQEANIYVQKLLKLAKAPHSDIKGQMDRIHQLLHVYETLHDIKFGYPDDSLEFMGGRVNARRSELKEVISAAFNDLLEQIKNDTSIDPSFGRPENINEDVDIYVLTYRVMRYVKKLSNNITLDSILINTDVQSSCTRDESTTAFGCYILKLVSCLKSNLKQKAGRLNGCAAALHIFWMNNLNYIVQEIKKVGLGTLLEEEELEIQQYLNNYIDSTWRKPLSRSIAKKSLDFNTAIEEIINAQASLKVPDPELKSKLRETVSGKIREFLIDKKLDLEKYLTGDLGSALSNLFEGSHQ